MRKLFDNIKVANSVRPQTATANVNGTGVDTQGFSDGMAILEVGAVSGTTPTLSVKLQESDDNSTFVDIAGAVFNTVTASNGSLIMRIPELNIPPRKRYIRAVSTIGGTSPSITHNVDFLLGQPYAGAVNND